MTMRVMRGKKATGTKGGKAKRLCQMSMSLIPTPRARKMTMRVMRGKKATGTKGGKAKRLCQMSRAGKLKQAKALLCLSM